MTLLLKYRFAKNTSFFKKCHRQNEEFKIIIIIVKYIFLYNIFSVFLGSPAMNLFKLHFIYSLCSYYKSIMNIYTVRNPLFNEYPPFLNNDTEYR